MRILLTGVSGYLGAALVDPLRAAGHELRGFARDPRRVSVDVPVVQGDALTGDGLDEALTDVDVAYFLIHSMEGTANGFAERERRSATLFADAAERAGVRRVVYLGGPVPEKGTSQHLASRVAVEEVLLGRFPEGVGLRAAVVVGARSRSFRFLVRLLERVPLTPLPVWRAHRTRPVDERDILATLVAAASTPHADGATLSLDVAGPDTVTYAEFIDRIREALILGRPVLPLPLSATAIAAPVAAAIAGEDAGFIGPLMESLAEDLLPRPDHDAAALLGVRTHTLDAAIERALREWEHEEELAAR
ncbi:MAG: NAD(P)H-binding protein [Solirubrobacteraceae bacterium]|nr:NAD(P)H-binding protein [Solirubrobacteraceae bacterium]